MLLIGVKLLAGLSTSVDVKVPVAVGLPAVPLATPPASITEPLLVPEMMADNLATQHGLNASGRHEIRPSDTVEEKTSLSERFGLWLSFYSFDQDEYLQIAANWLKTFDLDFDESARKAALDFSLTRGARSGRIAYQFARDYSGKVGLALQLDQSNLQQINQSESVLSDSK